MTEELEYQLYLYWNGYVDSWYNEPDLDFTPLPSYQLGYNDSAGDKACNHGPQFGLDAALLHAQRVPVILAIQNKDNDTSIYVADCYSPEVGWKGEYVRKYRLDGFGWIIYP